MAANWRCRLFWGNPFTSPPDGRPRIVKAILCDKPYPIPSEIQEMSGPGSDFAPGTGWTIGWECIEQHPVKRWSTKAKARVRKLNLQRRIEKRFPLFAADFIATELARRPRYFAGEDVNH